MALYSDATALLALGSMQWLYLLQFYHPEVVASRLVVEQEARSVGVQIAEAEAKGWLRVEDPPQPMVDAVLRATEDRARPVHAGEVGTCVLLRLHNDPDDQILLDDGGAFAFVQGSIRHWRRLPEVVCLAQVLHALEDTRHLPTAAPTAEEAMQQLLDQGRYLWAANVYQCYKEWCGRHGKTPVPRARRPEER